MQLTLIALVPHKWLQAQTLGSQQQLAIQQCRAGGRGQEDSPEKPDKGRDKAWFLGSGEQHCSGGECFSTALMDTRLKEDFSGASSRPVEIMYRCGCSLISSKPAARLIGVIGPLTSAPHCATGMSHHRCGTTVSRDCTVWLPCNPWTQGTPKGHQKILSPAGLSNTHYFS